MDSKNTAEQWGLVWQDASSKLRERVFSIETIQRGMVWSLIGRWLGPADWGSVKTIEIGAGAGTVSAVFARHGARVTVLDYATEAHKVSSELFEHLGFQHESVLANALDLPDHLLGRYDVAMSYGLAEHFEGPDRTKIIKAHFDLVRPGGLVVISVPNRHCWPYRFWKAAREARGRWHYGLEIPFSRGELLDICRNLGIADLHLTGSPFIRSFDFVLPFARWKRSLEKRLLKDRRFDPRRIRPERETLLGSRLGMTLLLIARKPT